MIEQRTDIFNFVGEVDAVCFTSNASLNRNGEAAMGAGVAKAFAQKYPFLPKVFGKALKAAGDQGENVMNFPMILGVDRGTKIMSFPTKPGDTVVVTHTQLIDRYASREAVGKKFPGWKFKSSAALIGDSAAVLKSLADNQGWKRVVIPKPGCRNGELSWDVVKTVLEPLLDNRFIICYL